jgi:hypothetical protein
MPAHSKYRQPARRSAVQQHQTIRHRCSVHGGQTDASLKVTVTAQILKYRETMMPVLLRTSIHHQVMRMAAERQLINPMDHVTNHLK